MRSKWNRYLRALTSLVLVGSSFFLTSITIYTFTKNQFINRSVRNLLPPPIFNQSEINQFTTFQGIKIDTFKVLITQKTLAKIQKYYVNSQNSSWMINVFYSWLDQDGFWIYELKYD